MSGVQGRAGTADPSSSPAGSPATDVPTGDVATWTIDEGEAVTAETTSFAVMVSRLGCSGGVTGDVRDPVIVDEPDQVVITFSVVPLDPTFDYTCPTNDANSVVVQLDEPLGHRRLVDGACLRDARAMPPALCDTDGVRLQAPP